MTAKVFTGKLQLVELEPRIAPSAVFGAISEGFLAFAAFADDAISGLDTVEVYSGFDEFDLDAELDALSTVDIESSLEPLLTAEIDASDSFAEFTEPVEVFLADLGFDGPEVQIEMDTGAEFMPVELAPDVQAEVLVEENVEVDVDADVGTEE